MRTEREEEQQQEEARQLSVSRKKEMKTKTKSKSKNHFRLLLFSLSPLPPLSSPPSESHAPASLRGTGHLAAVALLRPGLLLRVRAGGREQQRHRTANPPPNSSFGRHQRQLDVSPRCRRRLRRQRQRHVNCHCNWPLVWSSRRREGKSVRPARAFVRRG